MSAVDTVHCARDRCSRAYQPEPVAGAHLVLADFVQSAHDRFVTVVFGDQDTDTTTLTGTAPHATTEVAAWPGPAGAVVQKRHAPVDDRDLGWLDVGQAGHSRCPAEQRQAT